MNDLLLSVSNLTMRFGGLLAIDNVNFNIRENEIFAIIGPNGAGKTTVFNCVSGFYQPIFGQIILDGKNITGKSSHKIARCGLVRTFQNIRLFKQLTVLENLLIAQNMQLESRILHGLFHSNSYRTSENKALKNAQKWLDLFNLLDFSNQKAGNLSYGHQRRLEIARCMATNPKILMLDEPAAGLNPQEKNDLQNLINILCKLHNISVLLIEHDMSLVMEISNRILVMEHGRPLITGTPEEVQTNELVIKAYLGDE